MKLDDSLSDELSDSLLDKLEFSLSNEDSSREDSLTTEDRLELFKLELKLEELLFVQENEVNKNNRNTILP